MTDAALKIAMVSDTRGKDDEGMKKVARRIADVVNASTEHTVELVSTLQSISVSRKVNAVVFVGGPSYKTILVAFLCRLLNRRLKTFLTFTNPFFDAREDRLIRMFPPTMNLVSSTRWEEHLETLGVKAAFVNVAGVDIKRFRFVDQEQKALIRERLGWSPDKRYVLHVGHLKADRNVSFLATLQGQSNLQVVVVGSTTTRQSDAEVTHLKSAGCTVVASYIPAIEEYYQAADCYVFPTVDERAAIQVPLSVLEALACGLPVVSTRFGGLPKVLASQKQAMTYIAGDDEAELLRSVLEKDAHIERSAGWDEFIEDLSWDARADDLVAAIQDSSR